MSLFPNNLIIKSLSASFSEKKRGLAAKNQIIAYKIQ
jgi:hypothetical protein